MFHDLQIVDVSTFILCSNVDNEHILSGQLEEMAVDVMALIFEKDDQPPKETLRYSEWCLGSKVHLALTTNSKRQCLLSFSSKTFHEVISFLAEFAMKMQEGEYDAEPKEEIKVSKIPTLKQKKRNI